MIKIKISIILSTLVATLLGIFSQDLAYYLNEHFIDLWPSTYVVIGTLSSIFLYALSLLLIFVLHKKYKLPLATLWIYILVVGVIGAIVSLWSIFVMAMWMG